MALEPGFVPNGWTRGDPLYFINKDFQYGPEMAIMRNAFRPFDEVVTPSDAAGIRVHYSEKVRAQAWLNWWGSNDA